MRAAIQDEREPLMPHVAWLGLGTIFAMAGVASFIAGHSETAIGFVAISVVFDVLYILAVRDRRKSSEGKPLPPDP